MSTVSFFTALNRPLPPPPTAKHRRGALQSGAPAAVALKRKHTVFSVRANGDNPSSVSDHAFGIQPFGKWWRIKEDKEHVKLWFNVGRDTSKDNLAVKIEDDVLLVSSMGNKLPGSTNGGGAELDVRLLVPNGYDKTKVEAELTFGSLLLTIGKKIKPDADKAEPNITISPIPK